MDQKPPMDKLFDTARNRAKLKQLREKLAQKEYQQAEKILQQYQLGEQVNSEEDGDAGPEREAEAGAPEPPPEMVKPEAPTYKEMAQDAALKNQYGQSRPLVRKPGQAHMAFFRKHCSERVCKQMETDERLLHKYIRGVREDIVALSCGIKDFAAVAAGLPPDRLLTLLQVYLSNTLPVVRDEYAGCVGGISATSILVYYGIPYAEGGAEQQACRAAADMIQSAEAVNSQLASEGLPALGIAVGLESGQAFAGFPLADFMPDELIVSGEVIDIARELRRHAAAGEILAGPGFAGRVADDVNIESAGISIEFTGRDGAADTISAARLLT